jgi:hypothetical protein
MFRRKKMGLSLLGLLLTVAFIATGCHGSVHGYREMWQASATMAALPESGAPWSDLVAVANRTPEPVCIVGQASDHNVVALANALVFAGNGLDTRRDKARDLIGQAIGKHNQTPTGCTNTGGRALEAGRNIFAYILAADIINLPQYDSTMGTNFSNWLNTVESYQFPNSPRSGTLRDTFEHRPDNWGSHAGSTQLAIDVWQGDSTGWHRINQVFNRFTGNRGVPHPAAEFDFGDGQVWSTTPTELRGINLPGTVNSVNADGFIIRDVARGEPLGAKQSTTCPVVTNYFAGGFGGYLQILQILERLHDSGNLTGTYAGDPETYTFSAMNRAAEALERLDNNCNEAWWETNDLWQQSLVNYIYPGLVVEEDPAPDEGKVNVGTAWAFQ